MAQETQLESVTLYFREGTSDKVYQASIESSAGGFLVNFAYGRRGSTMQTGTKTAKPVDRASAKKIFDKLVQEKTAKGYTPGEEGTPYQFTNKEQQSTGIVPQLLNPMDEAEAESFLSDDRWWMQEKFDGKRMLIRKQGDAIIGINRTGLSVGLPMKIADAVRKLLVDQCLLDTEAIGDLCHAFDLLERNGVDLRKKPYAERYSELLTLIAALGDSALRHAATAAGTPDKRSMFERFKRENREGVVFKDRTAHYAPGRPAGGGSQRKLKFYATASCIVARGKSNKRSVALELFSETTKVSVGSVTIPPNKEIPSAGDIVEIRYLYAYPGGSLYQPVYLNKRDDITPKECTLSQLKLKREEADGEE